MRYYSKQAEEMFFEVNRFSDENMPKYKDIAFMLNLDMPQEQLDLIKDNSITRELWKKIKKIAYFDYSKEVDFPNLREEVFSKNPMYSKYLEEGSLYTFDDYIYAEKPFKEALKDVNVSTYSSMYEYFALGENIGTCGRTSTLTGVMFDDVLCCKGYLKHFIGTPASENGNHAWIEVTHEGRKIIVDTSLLLIIPKELGGSLGYNASKTNPIQQMWDNSDIGDTYWEQYNILKKQTTKNKASYELYCRAREKLQNKTISLENGEHSL